MPQRTGQGARHRIVWTAAFEDHVIEAPSKSTRRLAQELHILKDSVWKELKKQLLHPYQGLWVQAMGPTDYEPRVQFCQWMIQCCTGIPYFEQFVLLMDGACFTHEGAVNCCNNHVWNNVNPCATLVASNQHRFLINWGWNCSRLISRTSATPFE